MLMVNALKTVCDLLLGFIFAALFNACSRSWILIGAVLALGFLSSLILQKTKGGLAARILCTLLPAMGLFAAHSLAEALYAAVVVLFNAAVTVSGKSGVYYEDYKYWFGFPAVPVLVVFIICFSKWPVRPAATVCAAAYLFLGVLVLRRKRMGSGAGTKLRVVNVAEVFGTVAIAILASLLFYLVLKYSSKVLETLLLPFGLLLNGVVFLGTRFIGLFKKIFSDEPELPTETESLAPEEGTASATQPAGPKNDAAYAQAESVIKVLVVLLVLAVLAYLLYRFYRMVRRTHTEEPGAGEAFEEGGEEAHRARASLRKRKKHSGLSNNERIRRIYSEYLIYVRAHGVEISRQTTSADVLEEAAALTAFEGAERLRELYIRARYYEAEDLSDAEADEAKALLEAIRKQGLAGQGGRMTTE